MANYEEVSDLLVGALVLPVEHHRASVGIRGMAGGVDDMMALKMPTLKTDTKKYTDII